MPGQVAVSSAFVAAARSPLKSTAKRSTTYKNGVDTVGTVGRTSAHPMVVTVNSAGELVLRYGNWQWGGQSDSPNPIIVSGEIRKGAGGALLPITFGGAASVTIANRTFVDSDPITLPVVRGDVVWVRTFYRGTVGTDQAPSDWYSDTGNLQPWCQDGNHLGEADPTTGSTPTAFNNTFYYSPVALLGRDAAPNFPVWAIVGDSNAHGQGDTGAADLQGFARRALNNRWGYMHMAQGGAAAVAFATNLATVSALMVGCTHAIVALGTNDFGSATAAAILAANNQIAAELKRRGVHRVICCTIPPNTSSTDNWVTVANQTPSAQDGTRTAVNDAMRTLANMNAGGSLSSFDWIADTCFAVEVNASNVPTLNGARWRVDTGVPYGTAPHYSTVGHTAAAVPLSAAIDAVLAGSTKGISQA